MNSNVSHSDISNIICTYDLLSYKCINPTSLSLCSSSSSSSSSSNSNSNSNIVIVCSFPEQSYKHYKNKYIIYDSK